MIETFVEVIFMTLSVIFFARIGIILFQYDWDKHNDYLELARLKLHNDDHVLQSELEESLKKK